MEEIRQIYESKKIIENYVNGFKDLMLPEKIIHQYIVNKKDKNYMLDLGIGTGRTTSFFAPLFSHYSLDERMTLCSYANRSLEDDGIFAFSTHNAKAIKRQYSYRLPSKTNPLGLIKGKS